MLDIYVTLEHDTRNHDKIELTLIFIKNSFFKFNYEI